MGSKPITSNVTVPTTSFLRVLCHCKFVTIGVNKYYLHYRCSMSYDVIYDSFPINSQYLKTCEVLTALYMVVLLINQSVFHHLAIAVLKMLIHENLGLSPWRNLSLLVHKKVDFSFHLRVVQFQWAFVLQPPSLNSGLFVITFQLDVFYDLFIRKDTLQRSKSLACSAFSNHNCASKKPVVRHIGFSERATRLRMSSLQSCLPLSNAGAALSWQNGGKRIFILLEICQDFCHLSCKVFYYLVDD